MSQKDVIAQVLKIVMQRLVVKSIKKRVRIIEIVQRVVQVTPVGRMRIYGDIRYELWVV